MKRQPKNAADVLDQCAATYRERNKVYGDNYLRVGAAMAALFPQGVTIKTVADWHRIHMLLLTQVKLSRYITNFNKGGHKDSIHDAAVYCAMLEDIDNAQPKGS